MSAPHDLITEHAELEARCNVLREEIREVGWGGGSVNRIRNLKASLFEAEDRIREIEGTRTWQRQDEEEGD